MRNTIFVTRIVPEAGLKLLREKFDVDVLQDSLPPDRYAIITRAKGTIGLLTLLIDKNHTELMDATGAQLRGIAN